MTKMLDVHPFEKAGLGLAPFRFVGMEQKVFVAFPGAPAQPGGTCDYCGNGIKNVFYVQSADGKRFGVGCDCILKLDKACLVNASDFQKAVLAQKREEARKRTAARHDREAATIEAGMKLLDDPRVVAALESRPHPNDGMAKAGKTLADYVDWMKRMAGASGMLRVVKLLRQVAAEVQ